MLTDRSLRAEPATADRHSTTAPPSPWAVAFAFLAVAVVLFTVVGLSVTFLPRHKNLTINSFPGRPWLSGWVQWDAGWFNNIADNGYFYDWRIPSSVAFFPGYPAAMRVAGTFIGNYMLAGILVTLASGVAAVLMFTTWVRARLSPAAAWTAVLLLIVYPFSFFFVGAIYVEALFVASILAAFLLLEKGHPVLAGLVGAFVTATRHVGIAIIVGLVWRQLEIRGAFGGEDGPRWRRWVPDLRKVKPGDYGVLLACLGTIGFCLYLWWHWDNPLLFIEAQKSWGVDEGPRTWYKAHFFTEIRDFRSPFAWIVYVSHPIMTILACCFLPRVFRRFGRAYGMYAFFALFLPALTLPNFFGMGRYVLPAFPCFAAAGEWLSERPRRRRVILPASALALVAVTSFFSRGVYVS
ncbi:MAG: mannosyltransferase family protein [Acidimicrobiales bacterium]